jgi:hypothetical protein
VSREGDKLALVIGAMEAMRDHLARFRDETDAQKAAWACGRTSDALAVVIDQALEDFPHLVRGTETSGKEQAKW